MRFVKDNRQIRSKESFLAAQIPEKYYDGLRLGEQIIPMKDIWSYVYRLETTKKLDADADCGSMEFPINDLILCI